MRLPLWVFPLIIGFLFIPLPVKACRCIGSGAPCEAFWNASTVFSGEIQKVNTITRESVMPDGMRVYGPSRKEVFISVIEKFSGLGEEKIVQINTGGGGGDCGYNFQEGRKYLVYAYKDPETGTLLTSICTRTRLLEKGAEDVEYFKSLKTAKSGARIYGTVLQAYTRRNDAPYIEPTAVPGIPVTAEGIGGKFKTRTNTDGKYEFTNLTPGEYKIALDTPPNLWGYDQSQSVKVYDKGCAGNTFFLRIKTDLSGKLLNEKAQPAANISVNLIPVEQVNNSSHLDAKYVSTDDQGNFLFHSIPSGKYYLGIRLTGLSEVTFPYPQTFYPGTLNLNEAQVISIEEGQVLENYNFNLPQKLSIRKISGTVVYPDGTPAANARLSANETEYFYSFSFNGVGSTKSDGTFSFELVDGIRYLIQPVVSATDTPSRQRHAEPIEVPAKGNVTNLKFVITEPNGTCDKCLRWKRTSN